MSAIAVDNGTTIIGGAARIHPEFRSSGIWKYFSQLAGFKIMEYFPYVKRWVFTSSERDYHLTRMRQGKEMSQYIMERVGRLFCHYMSLSVALLFCVVPLSLWLLYLVTSDIF